MKRVGLLAFWAFSALVLPAQNNAAVAAGGNEQCSITDDDRDVQTPVLQSQVIKLKNIEVPLFPGRHIRGDSDFNGCGQKVNCEVKLRPSPDKTELWADIFFRAEQDSCDRSTAEGRWSVKIFDMPGKYRINRVLSDQSSRTAFTYPPREVEVSSTQSGLSESLISIFEGNSVELKVLQKHGIDVCNSECMLSLAGLINIKPGLKPEIKVPATGGTLVKFFTISGETNNKNSSFNEGNSFYTGITRIEFFPVAIEISTQRNHL